MNRMHLTYVLLVLLTSACDRGGDNDGHSEEGSHAEVAEHREDEHDNEVHFTAEAIERAGIRVAAAERRALTGGVAIPAEVQFEPSSTAHVSPLVPGRITRVSVALGDHVRRDQLLAVVASSDVSTARSMLDQARARLAAAKSTLQRQQQLSTEGIGAARSLIDAEARVGELRAEVKGLRRQLSVFGSGSAGELKLTAPIEGVVVAVHGTLGETATPDRAAFVITDPTKVWVRGSVPELELARVQPNSTVIVRLHAFPDVTMH
ncbi:MAG: efflux RND transporter periplasmic adaptor subunit, partial [Polyangiaceae bacterium]|nr:efflux RND transporter periplasmic adaptor subunit [Polyangiaceae bacterium]